MIALLALAQTAFWTPIPKTDPANQLLALIREAQPKPSDLPENSTYNYIWAQNMMSWMVAERGGLMSKDECVNRLKGLLTRVADWKTYHGFYFDSYDSDSGEPTSSNVYFQGWWLWALILTKNAYPGVAPLADKILKRLDYDAAGMITADHRYLVADKDAKTGKISYPIQPTGDISGELRTPVICYTWLTGDITPWRVTMTNTFIDVGGQPILSVWHKFTFDPFFVHSCFPEVGYFQKSYENLVKGANAHRKENGMRFYATRMDALEAWKEDPAKWPNTEHRVAKPWTAWLTDPKAPVMDVAWVPGYGVTQYFDNWNFYWGYGATKLHPDSIGGPSRGLLDASFQLETNPAVRPPVLRRIDLTASAEEGAGDLVVSVNGVEVGRILPVRSASKLAIVPSKPFTLGTKNDIQLTSTGTGAWHVYQSENTLRPVRWRNGYGASHEAPAFEITVTVDGQRPDRENPYAFLCRADGAYGDYVWKLLPENVPDEFGKRLVAWVGDYSNEVRYAHVIYNVATTSRRAVYHLSPWEVGRKWRVVDYDDRKKEYPCTASGADVTWSFPGRATALLVPN